MYVLSKDKVLTILGSLCEGQSIRSLERQTGVNRNTIMSWLVRAGTACEVASKRILKELKVNYVQADELHSFIGRKTTDPALVGNRDIPTAYRLMQDVRRRTIGTFQLTTDGHPMYRDAAELAFGSEINFGQLLKVYSGDELVRASPVVVAGTPDVKKINTSYVERNNLTMRMSVRRLTRKTSAFSKTVSNHVAALHVYFAYYNFCR